MPNLLLFTAALLLCAVCAMAANRCPDCGNTSVPYPLSTGADCGDQEYKIRCDAGTLRFDTLNSSYSISSITPQIQRFVIRPASFAGNTCVTTDLPNQGIQLNESLPFNVTSSNTILYLNCTDTLLRSPLNCSSISLCHTYINGTRDAAACEDAPICCTFKAGGSTTSHSIRVRDAGCRAYRSFVNLDASTPVNRWPEPGVEIQWVSPREPVCTSQSDCTDGMNSTCGPDPATAGVSRCFCKSGLWWDPVGGLCAQNVTCQDPDGCGSTNKTPLIAGLTVGIGAALIAAVIAILVYRRHRRIKEAQDRLAREREEILNANGGGKFAKNFTGKEIKRATNSFSHDRLLGAGGYGEVYKGILDDGTIVAIKCAKLGNAKGTDQVLNEVGILCQVNHRSLVRLLGCCVELEQPIMVYEFIPNGTLLEHLQGQRPGGRGSLTWSHRLRIAHDTAEGLAYLHSSAVPPIYHRDVKSSNILLDEKMNAKVADFGLSRLAHTDMSHVSTCAQGTLGYLDPEYYRNYQLTDKSDVYSFGVVLLELLTSQKAIDFNRPADDVNLAVYVQRTVEEERLMDAIDPLLKEQASSLELETMKAMGFLAVGCLEERRQNRPSMKEVTEEIGYIISIATAKVVEQ
ncbi:wall-associated receptor kinase-like 20 [Vitis vinifera]|uniref:Wall-associated receptor kinase-like 20 n=3 Tax=Vitis vinifera TaxID=29760 RepID=A0A438JXI6_VITVI|nr:wall-associated receptor kinase-like 20 [Vitis vinifera]RVX13680.1 Wall-associated receptor kinase-like 20 [Vitis vinifera]|eukprot:XP_002282445.1 PREDICTED: wall-associated receptor kinase-like 20 [Vitis vinifera]